MSNHDGLSIVVPIFNEKKNLNKLINKIYSLTKIKKFEVIIVDDDSTDGTKKTLKKSLFLKKNLNYILRKKKPRDLSQSCMLGFRKAKFPNILVMDGDLQHNPTYINKLYFVLMNHNCDLVVGSRNLLKKKNKGLSLLRLTFSIILIFIVNLFLGPKTSDPMSGFFIFKKKIYIKNKRFFYNNGYKILLDIMYSSKNKLKIVDMNIVFKRRLEGTSKMNIKVFYYLGFFILKKFFSRLFDN